MTKHEKELIGCLKSLCTVGSLVMDELDSSQCGWYFHMKRELQVAVEKIKTIENEINMKFNKRGA